nr:T9SS type A sorting domain-containing protein [Ignavibacteriaceae bacterium]
VLKTANTVMSTEEDQVSPVEFTLYSNYPNPFNPSTTIKFAVPEGSDVKLSVFNTNGEEVGVIASGYFESGIHKVEFNANNLPSGIYFAVLNAGGKMLRQKMILLK